MYVYIYACVYARVHVHAFVCMCVGRVCERMRVYVCVCLCVLGMELMNVQNDWMVRDICWHQMSRNVHLCKFIHCQK